MDKKYTKKQIQEAIAYGQRILREGEDTFFSQKTCDRCHGPLSGGRTMSMYNTDCICMKCAKEERQRKDYKQACDAEASAVKRGDRNFKGIGFNEDGELGSKAHTKKQIQEAIAYWESRLAEMDEISENIKNTVLKWLGKRSTWTKLEDLIDMVASSDTASSKFRRLFDEVMLDFKAMPEFKKMRLKAREGGDVFDSEIEQAIAEKIKKMVGKDMYADGGRRYRIPVKKIAKALVDVLVTKDRAAYLRHKQAEAGRNAAAKKAADDERFAKWNPSTARGHADSYEWTYDPGYADPRDRSPWHRSDK